MIKLNCIICCKTLLSGEVASGGSGKSLVQRFTTSVDNHFGYRRQECGIGTSSIMKSSTIQGPPDIEDDQTGDLLACCAECSKLVERFCDLHQEIKCLELHLLSKLQTEPEKTSSAVQKPAAKKKKFPGNGPFEPVTGEIRKDLRKKFSRFTLSPEIILQRVDHPTLIDLERGNDIGLVQETHGNEEEDGVFVMDADVEVKVEISEVDEGHHYYHQNELDEGVLGVNDRHLLSADESGAAAISENADPEVDISMERDFASLSQQVEVPLTAQQTWDTRIPVGEDNINSTGDYRHSKQLRRIHRCKVCRKGFSTPESLIVHQKMDHAPKSNGSDEDDIYEDESEDECKPRGRYRTKAEIAWRKAMESFQKPASAEQLAPEWLPLKVLENGPTLDEFLSKPTSEMLTFVCQVGACKSRFMSEVELEKHSKLHGKFKCSFCPVQLSYAPRLALHEGSCSYSPFSKINESTGESPGTAKKFKKEGRKCPRCPQKFCILTAVDYIAHHLEIHQGIGMPILLFCPLCRRPFYQTNIHQLNRETVIRHMLQSHDASNRDPSQVYQCLKCQPPVSFRGPRDRSSHDALVHTARKRCEEPECVGKKFASLKSHKFQFHSDSPKYFPFACEDPECQVRYATPDGLRLHMAKYHPELTTFNCTNCDKTFDFKYKLEIHKFSHSEDSQPTDQYVFKCSSCSEINGNYFMFKNHMKQSHDMVANYSNFDPSVIVKRKPGEKVAAPFSCPHCEEKYAYRKCLRKHIKIMHSGSDLVPAADESMDKISSTSVSGALDEMTNAGKTSSRDTKRKRLKRKKSPGRASHQKKMMKSSEAEGEV